MHTTLTFATPGRGFTDITADVERAAASGAVRDGLVNLFLLHTSASLIVQENADPDVRHDLEQWMALHVPDGDPAYRHDAEGPDDMPSHIRAVLTATSLSVPLRDGRLLLGTWQAIYLYEHRYQAHQRRIALTVLGA